MKLVMKRKKYYVRLEFSEFDCGSRNDCGYGDSGNGLGDGSGNGDSGFWNGNGYGDGYGSGYSGNGRGVGIGYGSFIIEEEE